MSNAINQYQDRFPTASMTIVADDQSPTSRVDAPSTQFIEINSTSINAMNRVFKSNNTLYPTAVLAELSTLVRRVRATSPHSALADLADSKIGKIIALRDSDDRFE